MDLLLKDLLSLLEVIDSVFGHDDVGCHLGMVVLQVHGDLPLSLLKLVWNAVSVLLSFESGLLLLDLFSLLCDLLFDIVEILNSIIIELLVGFDRALVVARASRLVLGVLSRFSFRLFVDLGVSVLFLCISLSR